MPIYDHECADCGRITEAFAGLDETEMVCVCGGTARRIISVCGQYVGNQDASWIRSVLDVVDRTSTKPHVREFVKNPTRSNYRAWMKGEGIRPVDYTEHGGPPVYRKPEPSVDTKKMARDLYEKHRARKAIEVRA